MNHKEINEMVLKYQKAEEQDTRDYLWEKIYASQEGLIKMFVTGPAIRQSEQEDLLQELIYATLECINKYRPDMGANFSTYLLFYLRKGKMVWSASSKTVRVQQFAKEQDKNTSFINLSDDSVKIEILDKFNWETMDEFIDFKAKLERLKELETEIVFLRIEGYSYKEIGLALGIEEEEVSKMFFKVIDKLKR